MEIFTLGHSTRKFNEFLEILKLFNIQQVIDVRRFPSSRKFPWFDKGFLEKELRGIGITYLHFQKLGGFRKEGYNSFSKSKEFKRAIEELIQKIDKKRSVIFCSEFKWWKCHRRYIANELAKKGWKVIHILTKDRTQEHKVESEYIKERMKAKIKCDRRIKS